MVSILTVMVVSWWVHRSKFIQLCECSLIYISCFSIQLLKELKLPIVVFSMFMTPAGYMISFTCF